ncbi:hypothetical protein AGMMS49965_15480 [Bacteroidia bacterium]|nr:hypothetical protein AGMMS49965_15480 [Bacteroidia bacterium]
MKKIFLFFAVFAATALWTGCEPIVDKHDAGGSIAATELQATATSVVKDGKNTNKVHVRCTSPVLCQWSDGVNTLTATEGYLTLLLTGEQTITLTAMTADGTTLTKSFTVNVEDMTEPVDPAFGFFCGSGEKVWEWNTTEDVPEHVVESPGDPHIWALCMAGTKPDGKYDFWGWRPDPADLSAQCADNGYANDGTGATMKFILSGKKFEKYDKDGTKIGEGKFEFDMTPTSVYGSVGKLTIKDTSILFPYDRNSGSVPYAGSEFSIIHVDNDRMLLYISASCGWYYAFTAQ